MVSHISVFCKRQLLICKAAWSYIPFHIFPRLVLSSQLALLQAAMLFCCLTPRVGWTGAVPFDRSSFSRWAQLIALVRCEGLCCGTKLFVDGSGAISCYTDTLPSVAYRANFVLALVSCLKCCLYKSSFLSYAVCI